MLDELPLDASYILDILKAEQAPLDIWLIIAWFMPEVFAMRWMGFLSASTKSSYPRFATFLREANKFLESQNVCEKEYFIQGKVEQFKQILEEGSSPGINSYIQLLMFLSHDKRRNFMLEVDEYYANVTYERIEILNALGAYYSHLAKVENEQREEEDYFIQAAKYYNKASRIDMHEPSTWIGRGQLLLTKGDFEQAFKAFKIVLDGDCNNVPALLGQACVHFSRGQYVDSLQLCKLEPDNVEALVALGILDLQTNEAAGIRKGMEKMQRAFEIYPLCAVSLNYLANHFLFTGKHFLVEQLTETALAVTMHGLTRAHSYYNLARSYHSKGDYGKAGMYYMASIKESKNPHEFVLPCYGLGQVQLKLGDLQGALTNFEIVLEVQPKDCGTLKALGHIYVQLGQNEKAQELFRKATKIDPQDPQNRVFHSGTLDLIDTSWIGYQVLRKCEGAIMNYFGRLYTPIFPDLMAVRSSSFYEHNFLKTSASGSKHELVPIWHFEGELDITAALAAFKSAHDLLKKGNEDVPLELLNNIGVLNLEMGNLQLACETFKEALGDGIWCEFFHAARESNMNLAQTDAYGESPNQEEQPNISHTARSNLIDEALYAVDASSTIHQYKDFQWLEEQGVYVELPWDKVTILFNLARVFEQMHNTESATILYHLILFTYPEYTDANLRLAAIAKARNDVQLSVKLIGDTLKVDDKCADALLMLGDLERKNDNWVKAKEMFQIAKDSTAAEDSYAAISLGNWNCCSANHNEKRNPKLEAAHFEKAKVLYTKTNGAGIVFAEKGQLDIAKDLFTLVIEATSGSSNVQMPDVLINLAHVHFAQGNFALAVKMYQNCLRKFYYNTQSEVLLYLARVHYEAQQWQDCRKTLLRAIHLDPSNYTLRFDVGVAIQKSSALTLQMTTRTVDEVRATVGELRNAIRLFSLLCASSNLHFHGLDEKKIRTHVGYCSHLLEAACADQELAELEEQQNLQRLEVRRQIEFADRFG
ncbi:UNVERIFIED_CONTAM: protein CTR9 [Sesamum calycinum]|uniref:Protein CTR9 n=1 Tax=Sesamum calycinum TaxID=2727403 RepID=A0AAW2NV09_9LAMI